MAAAYDSRGEPAWNRPDRDRPQGGLKEVATIGLDLAKTSVHFAGLDASEQALKRRRYSKGKIAEIAAKMDPRRRPNRPLTHSQPTLIRGSGRCRSGIAGLRCVGNAQNVPANQVT